MHVLKKFYAVNVYKLISLIYTCGYFFIFFGTILIYCFLYYECVVINAAQVPGTTQDHLQVFNIETKTKMKSYQMNQQVWIC